MAYELDVLRKMPTETLLSFVDVINQDSFIIFTDTCMLRTMVMLSENVTDETEIIYLQLVAAWSERPDWFVKKYKDFFHNPLDK